MDGCWWFENGNWLHGGWSDRHDDVRGDLCFLDGSHLHHRIHGRGRGLQPLLLLHFAVHVFHAHACYEQQSASAVLWMGGSRVGFLSVDWILVQQANRHFCQHEGISG